MRKLFGIPGLYPMWWIKLTET
uniref:Uncharacterized protein n=1 Tax=Rhizophora mucronata TaxID=61149 RepID=A0A2P2QHF5_RHIMU